MDIEWIQFWTRWVMGFPNGADKWEAGYMNLLFTHFSSEGIVRACHLAGSTVRNDSQILQVHILLRAQAGHLFFSVKKMWSFS